MILRFHSRSCYRLILILRYIKRLSCRSSVDLLLSPNTMKFSSKSLCHLYFCLFSDLKQMTFSPIFKPKNRSKTTTSCGSILFFRLVTTIRHYYYRFNVRSHWKLIDRLHTLHMKPFFR